MADASIPLETALKIAELLAIVGGGGLVLMRMTRMAARFEFIGEQQSKEISELKLQVVKIGDLMTNVAVQNERLDAQAKRINLLDQRYEELRHGEGFVYPLGTHLSGGGSTGRK